MPSKTPSCLPLHLVSQILRKLDSIQTLGYAILSHPTFYAAFKDAIYSITHGILMSQMGFQTRTLYYAIAAYEASRINYKEETEVTAFIRSHFDTLAQDPYFDLAASTGHLEPGVAAALSKTQVIVNYFTEGFVHDTSPRCLVELNVQPPKDLQDCSDREIFRVQRALYRHQTHCNLFFRSIDDLKQSAYNMMSVDIDGHQVRRHFFFSHSPWENEQLACIHDYLERVLSRSFDAVAQSDITWGALEVDWLSEGIENGQKQAFLSLGLAFLYKLDQIESYSLQYHALTRKGHKISATEPPKTCITIPCMMKVLYPLDLDFIHDDDRWPWERHTHLRELTPTQLRKLQSQGPLSIFDDATSQPERVCNSEAQRCGYVVWDDRAPHPAGEHLRQNLRLLREKTRARLEQRDFREMEKSWDRRKIMYRRGDRGRVDMAMNDNHGQVQGPEK